MRKRGGRKRALGTRPPLALPSRPDERRSLDFVSDAFTDGRRFRVLTVADAFAREGHRSGTNDICRRPSFQAVFGG